MLEETPARGGSPETNSRPPPSHQSCEFRLGPSPVNYVGSPTQDPNHGIIQANPVITHDGERINSTLKRCKWARPKELRFLVRLIRKEPSPGDLLSSIRALSKSVGVEARNPKQTSYGALEVDIFCPSRGDFEIFMAAAQPIATFEFVTDLNRAPEHLTDDETLAKARALFNAERYWECHEVLEGLWRQRQGEEKRLLQGIILVCAAFVHHQKGEREVALGVLRRAVRQLDYRNQKYGWLDVVRLKAEVEAILASEGFTNFKV